MILKYYSSLHKLIEQKYDNNLEKLKTSHYKGVLRTKNTHDTLVTFGQFLTFKIASIEALPGVIDFQQKIRTIILFHIIAQ